MKNKFHLFLVFFGFLGFTQPAGASYQDALELYNAGKFEAAVTAGREAGTPEGLTLAVRGQLVLIQYIFDEKDRTAAINRAIEDSETALALDPENIEAILNLGIIYGLRGRYEKSISDGKKSRDLLKRALKASPTNSWALGSLASWHAETIFQAGRLPAWVIFGAGRKRAFSLFARAAKLEPENLTIRAAYVRALLKVGDKKHNRLVNDNIEYILNAPAVNALEQMMKDQIRQIKKAIETNDDESLELLLDELRVPRVLQDPAE